MVSFVINKVIKPFVVSLLSTSKFNSNDVKTLHTITILHIVVKATEARCCDIFTAM